MIFHQPWNSRKNFNYNANIYADGTVWSSHFHSNYELVYLLAGQMLLTVNGAAHTLCAGELLLISPYAVHSFTVRGETRAWVGVFSDDFVAAFAGKHHGVQFSKFRCDAATETLLREHLFIAAKPARYLLMAYLYMVCHACVEGAVPLQSKSDPQFMQNVINYISAHFGEDISLKDLAARYNYEYHYFSAVFHDCFSMNFKSFLNIFRIERACELLREDACEITDVSRQCGFASIRNFNRVFKELIGLTPSAYRSQIKA